MLNTLLPILFLASPAQVSPDVQVAVEAAQAQIADFEEEKALQALSSMTLRTDLTRDERAHLELWRGVAALSLYRDDDARAAFATARGCKADIQPPSTVSPKIVALFTATAAGTCGAVAAAAPPPPAAAPANKTPRPAEVPPAADDNGGGISPLVFAGAGVGVAGGVVALVAVVAGVAALVLLGASFPVVIMAQAQERAADVRQMAMVGLGMRLGGGGVGLLGVVLLAGGLLLGAGAAALVAVGVIN